MDLFILTEGTKQTLPRTWAMRTFRCTDLRNIVFRFVCWHRLISFVRGPTNMVSQRLGGSESKGTEHPNLEVVSSRLCVRARSVVHVQSEIKWGL